MARRTGLSPHVIRIWEKRYGVVEPARTATNRRLYSDDQIHRLKLLREVTQTGHSIGNVAKLPAPALQALLAEGAAPRAGASAQSAESPTVERFLEECIGAVKALDARALDAALNRGVTVLGSQGLLQRVIAPLAQTIGDRWRDGTITAAHEHFASAVIRIFLGRAALPFAGTETGPVLVVATPGAQLHELGALLAGAAAANVGWQVVYLGASLPAAEIAGAARQNRARAVALSIVYPEDDPRLEVELALLQELMPLDVAILAGGRAAAAYRGALGKIGAIVVKDLTELCFSLDDLRKPERKSSQ